MCYPADSQNLKTQHLFAVIAKLEISLLKSCQIVIGLFKWTVVKKYGPTGCV